MSVQALGVVVLLASGIALVSFGVRAFFCGLLSEDEEARKELSAQGRRCGLYMGRQ